MVVVIRDKKGIKPVAPVPFQQSLPGNQPVMTVFSMRMGCDQHQIFAFVDDHIVWQRNEYHDVKNRKSDSCHQQKIQELAEEKTLPILSFPYPKRFNDSENQNACQDPEQKEYEFFDGIEGLVEKEQQPKKRFEEDSPNGDMNTEFGRLLPRDRIHDCYRNMEKNRGNNNCGNKYHKKFQGSFIDSHLFEKRIVNSAFSGSNIGFLGGRLTSNFPNMLAFPWHIKQKSHKIFL